MVTLTLHWRQAFWSGLCRPGSLARNATEKGGSCVRFYHVREMVFRSWEGVQRFEPPPQSLIFLELLLYPSTLLSYTPLQLSSISVRMNVGIDNLCFRQRFCVGWHRPGSMERNTTDGGV